eukprot:m.5417 g.5417  ORF g.5417 m.5417 type:complete len:169 (+) comp5449_c0_seq2:558-1064(+)
MRWPSPPPPPMRNVKDEGRNKDQPYNGKKMSTTTELLWSQLFAFCTFQLFLKCYHKLSTHNKWEGTRNLRQQTLHHIGFISVALHTQPMMGQKGSDSCRPWMTERVIAGEKNWDRSWKGRERCQLRLGPLTAIPTDFPKRNGIHGDLSKALPKKTHWRLAPRPPCRVR